MAKIRKQDFGLKRVLDPKVYGRVAHLVERMLPKDPCIYCRHKKRVYTRIAVQSTLFSTHLKNSIDDVKEKFNGPSQATVYKKIKACKISGFIPGALEKIQEASKWYDNPVVSIDDTLYPYYKRKVDAPQWAVKGRPKRSTVRFFKVFAVSVSFRGGPTYFIYAKNSPKGFDVRANLDIVLGILKPILKRKILLADRGFYSARLIQTVVENGFKFITPAKKYRGILERADQMENDSTREYVMSTWGCKVLIVKNHRGLIYICSRNVSPEETFVYRERWGIETGFRDINHWLRNPPTRDGTIKEFYFVSAAIIYNEWQRANYLDTIHEHMEIKEEAFS